MSEERTQAPSQRRRQEAKDRGQVARSPELTAAAGLLAATIALAAWGDDLAAACLDLVSEPLRSEPLIAADASFVTTALRAAAGRVLTPLAAIVAAAAVAAVGTHQLQVGGLFVPALLAPDPSRLMGLGMLQGFGTRAGRGLWGWAKAVLLIGLGGWLIYANADALRGLGAGGPASIAAESGGLLRKLVQCLAVGLFALGVVDFALQRRRIEAMLQMSPEEHREELRSLDGDPSLRARRRRLAEQWRHDPNEVLAEATLVLTAPESLVVVLGGGPPPNAIRVRHIARGASAPLLRRAAERLGIPQVNAPAIARFLARGRIAARGIPDDMLAELEMVWPTKARVERGA